MKTLIVASVLRALSETMGAIYVVAMMRTYPMKLRMVL